MGLVLRCRMSGGCSGYSSSSNSPEIRGQIELENSVFVAAKPLDEIKGKFIITTDTRITCREMRVQLNAIITLKKYPETGRPDCIQEGMLQGSRRAVKCGDYINSPIRKNLINGQNEGGDSAFAIPWSKQCRKGMLMLEPGKHSYPFTLIMPVEPLPAPFKTQYGRLEYKIAAYLDGKVLGCEGRFAQIAACFLKFNGYNNLSLHPPFIFETNVIENFDEYTQLEVVLRMQKTGFLPGEEIRFELHISNSSRHFLKNITVHLVQQINYDNGRGETFLELDTKMINCEEENENNIVHIGELRVPEDCIPSYDVKSVYTVTHFVQYKIFLADHPISLAASTGVIVGTTNEPCGVDEGIAISRRMDGLSIRTTEPEIAATRRTERSNSATSIVSFPPDYSVVASRPRSTSMSSLETLPPNYEDLE